MSDTTVLLVINSIILPMVAIILKINADQLKRIAALEELLDECLQKNSQAGTWQAGQERQRDMLVNTEIHRGDTKPLK